MPINLKVLDISHHNDGPNGGPIDFRAIYDFGVRGIIHKSSQGIVNVDKTYARRRQAALDAGLLWGAYHFADGMSAREQASHFLDAASPDSDTLIALDYEPNQGNEMDLDGVRTFLTEIERQIGRRAVLYSGNLIKETLGDDNDPFFAEHKLWLAQYGPIARCPKTWASPWLWQFSGDGVNNHGIKIPGVNSSQSGQIDMNTFNGDDEKLAAEWAQ